MTCLWCRIRLPSQSAYDDIATNWRTVQKSSATPASIAGVQDEGETPDSHDGEDDPNDSDRGRARGKRVNTELFVIDVSGGGAAMRLEYPLPLTPALWQNVDALITAIKAVATAPRPAAPEEGKDTGQ